MADNLKKALKKAKRKQVLKITGITLITMVIFIPLFFKVGDYFAAKNASKLHDALDLQHALTQPNVQIDSQLKAQNAIFGGNIVTNRSKNINGYLVEWSTLTSRYDWLFTHIDTNELIPGSYWSDSQFYQYDKQTKTKSATFYHPLIKEYYAIPNELEAVAEMDNYVAEVAISFDRPYTFAEIESKIPDNLNIVWLYMISEITDESQGPSGLEIYGFAPSSSPEDEYKMFLKDLEAYAEKGYDDAIHAFLKANQEKDFKDVEILGMMLTGQAKNFKALENQGFIRASSVGATAEMVPYIQPDK